MENVRYFVGRNESHSSLVGHFSHMNKRMFEWNFINIFAQKQCDCRLPWNYTVMNGLFFTFLQFAHRSLIFFCKILSFSTYLFIETMNQQHPTHRNKPFSVNILCLSIFICLVVVLVSGTFYYFDRIALQAHKHKWKKNRFQRESESNGNNCWKNYSQSIFIFCKMTTLSVVSGWMRVFGT